MKDNSHWMRAAIEEAERAPGHDDVPVGAVVVHEGMIVGSGHNRCEEKGIPFEHAEVVAMWNAVEARDKWVLTESTLFVTVEPCVMCVGAALLARIPRIVFGVREPKTGACESVLAIPSEPDLDHQITVIGGVEEARCRELVQEFFRRRRG